MQAQEDTTTLDPIAVTVIREDESQLDIAGNITRIDDAETSIVGHTHISELLIRSPATWVSPGSGQEHLTAIRSPIFTGPGSCGAFLYLEDGVPIRPAGFCNVNQLMEINSEQMQAVEVIRGPGSALYGANALHGMLNFLTPDANAGPGFSTALETGPDDYYRGRINVGGNALSDDTAWRVLANGTHDGGARDDSGFDQGKMNLLYRQDIDNGSFEANLAANYLNQRTAGFVFGLDAYKDPQLSQRNDQAGAYRDNEAQRLLTHWQWGRGDDGRRDLRVYARHSRTQFRQHFLPGTPDEDNGQNSLGVLLSRHVPFLSGQLVYGIDAEYTQGYLREEQFAPTPGSAFLMETRPAGKHYDYKVNATMAAPYVHLQQSVRDWEWILGLRAEYIGYDYDNQMSDGNLRDDGTACGFGGCLYTRPSDRRDDFFEVAPKLGALYHIDDRRSVYASLLRGFRPPQTTELYRLQSQQNIASLDPVIMDSLEFGYKQTGPSLSYDAATYYMKKRNLILRDSNGFNVDNGRTRHYGVEARMNWHFARDWAVQGAGTYAKHLYDFDASVAGGNVITSGDEVDSAPRTLGSLQLRWDDGRVFSELEWEHIGSYFIDPEDQFKYPGYDLINLRAGWRWNPRWSSLIRVNNLTDKAYAERADFAFGNFRYTPGHERSVFLEIRYARQ